jgi:IS4 transposase
MLQSTGLVKRDSERFRYVYATNRIANKKLGGLSPIQIALRIRRRNGMPRLQQA